MILKVSNFSLTQLDKLKDNDDKNSWENHLILAGEFSFFF